MSVVDSPSRFTPPPSIVLLRDFVNTVEWQVDRDEWETPVDLGSWFAEHAELAVHHLSIEDLELARRVREGLRSVLLMNAGHEPLEPSIADLNDALGVVPLRMRFDDDGSSVLTAAHPSALGRPLSVVIEAIEAAHRDGSWPRLKACSRDSCRWAYWDSSRNRSGRWCSMAGCGNYIKMRRRNSPDEAKTDVISESASNRIPTLVDVAGRAGVSMKTVSNVVTGAFNVAEPTRSRVLTAIEELGYHPTSPRAPCELVALPDPMRPETWFHATESPSNARRRQAQATRRLRRVTMRPAARSRSRRPRRRRGCDA